MKLTIKLKNNNYFIIIKKKSIKNIGKIIKKFFPNLLNNKIIIITDNNVDKLYGELVEKSIFKEGFFVNKIVLPHGEKIKNIKYALYIYKKLISYNINRSDLIVNLGGGVIGDLGGYVASTYLRGIKYIQIPTTLLAQTDSSIGGKVGINLLEGKNLIGSFYHPKCVIIDVETLKTLPKKFFIDGMSEVIKYGAIFNCNIFEIIKTNNYFKKEIKYNELNKLIYKCCYLKKKIIEKDEKEINDRMLLNFGHTIGHGIEKANNYKKITHGEAVAVGMSVITKASEKLGFTDIGTYDKLTELIKNIGLKNSFPLTIKKEIVKAIFNDKKRIGDFINLILLKKIGFGFILKLKKNKIEKILDKGLE